MNNLLTESTTRAMGNKDRRKEKKKLKQPKTAAKPAKPGSIITTRPAK